MNLTNRSAESDGARNALEVPVAASVGETLTPFEADVVTDYLGAPDDVTSNVYGLNKVIVINSYVKHKARIQHIDNHTHISGRNGRGKTTLLRLIPLFYGEQPSKMIKPSGEVLRPIREYIFDSNSSYLIFEYRNHDGIKLAIMYYSPNNNSPSYILCDGPYASELFKENGRFVESGHLNGRLKTLRRNPTSSMGVMEYQSIIQGRNDRVRTSGDIRSYIRRFGLVEKGNLSGIEKIASAMFFKDITFVALKRMAYAVMNDLDETAIKTSISDKELNPFFANFRAYQDVMKQSQAFLEGSTAHIAIGHARTSIANVAIKANLLSRHQGIEIKSAQDEIDQLYSDIRETTARYNLDAAAASERIAELKGQVGRADALILQINLEQSEFERQDIDALRELVTSIPLIKGRIFTVTKILNALKEASGNINQKYDSEVTKVHEQSEARAMPLRAEHRLITDEATLRQAKIQSDLAVAQNQLNEDIDRATGLLNLDLQEANEKLTTLKEQRASIRTSLEFEQKISDLTDKKTGLQVEINTMQTSLQTLVDQHVASRSQHLQGDLQLTAAKKHLLTKEQRHEHLLKLNSPAPGTLLHHLRANVPGWLDNIGKVVRDDVLLNADLAPMTAVDGAGGSFYGIDIDLSKIDFSLAAREHVLAEEVDAVRVAIADDKLRVQQLEMDLAKVTNQLESVQKRRNLTEGQLTAKKRNLAEMDAPIAAAERAALEEKLMRSKEAELQIGSAATELKAASEAISKRPIENNIRRRSLNATFDAMSGEMQAWAVREMTRVEKMLADEEHNKKETLVGINTARAAELKKGGVDMDALQVLQGRIAKDETQHEKALLSQVQVDKYTRWLETRPFERQNGMESVAANNELLSTEEAVHQKSMDAFNNIVVSMTQRKDQREARLVSAKETLRRLDDFRSNKATEEAGTKLIQPVDIRGITLEGLANEHASSSAEMKKALVVRNQKIAPIHALFNRPGEQTHVAKFGMSLPSVYSDSTGSSTVELTINVLKSWYAGGSEQSRDMINGECQSACGLFQTYLDKLKDFQETIGRLSRQLQSSLNSDMVFDAIRKVSISLSGRVERVAYWVELNNVVSDFGRWKEIDCEGMPPANLINNLSALTNKISGGKLEESPESLIDMEIMVDDGTEKRVSNEAELKNVSSNGLSYMIMCLIFVAFVNRVRKDANVWLTWALDEIGTIDPGNSQALLKMLAHHKIRLISASPVGEESVMGLFQNHYEILPDFEIQRCSPAQRRNQHVG